MNEKVKWALIDLALAYFAAKILIEVTGFSPTEFILSLFG